MSYSFRIRFKLPDDLRIGIESDKLMLTPPNSKPKIALCSQRRGVTIAKTTELVLRGDGYGSEDEARTEGEQLRDVLMLAFARLHIGADFDHRAPRGGVTNAGLKMLEQHTGKRTLSDVHGLMTFETRPLPQFVDMHAKAVVTTGQERFMKALRPALKLRTRLGPEERVAFDLFSASFFESYADARLLTLMMAAETLLNRSPRCNAAQQHVSELMRITNDSSTLAEEDRQSLRSSLQGLKKESVNQAGRKLAERLAGHKYLDRDPKDFFTYCYKLRSSLVHGHMPRPTDNEVGPAAVNLASFVGDLLAGPLLEKISV